MNINKIIMKNMRILIFKQLFLLLNIFFVPVLVNAKIGYINPVSVIGDYLIIFIIPATLIALISIILIRYFWKNKLSSESLIKLLSIQKIIFYLLLILIVAVFTILYLIATGPR